MATTLSPVIAQIYRDAKPRQPVVQIISIKGNTVAADGTMPTRVKVQFSDGEQYGLGVLISEPAKQVMSEEITLNSLVRIKEYATNQLAANMKLCIAMKLELVQAGDELQKIGEPVMWDTVPAADSPMQARPAALAVDAKPAVAGAAAGATASPHTSNTSSRTAPSNFPPASLPPAASSPLVAARATPIEGLNPYQNKWLIKARVVAKSEMRTFSNARGDSSVFSIDLCDDSAEIRATAWREVADRLFSQVEVGKTYLIARGQLKPANKKYSTLNNSYEITLTPDTQVQLCDDEPDAAKPKIHYRFVSIADLAARPAGATVDVMGVVSSVSACTSIQTKAGKELSKRTMVVADDSNASIELTLWAGHATNFPEDLAPATVVAFKALKTTEWNQRSLQSTYSMSMEVAPELEAAERLTSWWAAGGGNATVSLSQDTRGERTGGPVIDKDARTTTADLSAAGELSGADPEYGTVRCMISKFLAGPSSATSASGEAKPMWYASCPKCNKKVVGDEASGHSCENCGWSGAECSYRYILPLVLMDGEATMVATAFDVQALSLLGKPAAEMKRLQATDVAAYDAVFAKAQWRPMLVRMRAKMESYAGNSRLKSAVLKAEPISYATEAALLLKDIKSYELPDPPPYVPKADADATAERETEPMATEEGAAVKEEGMQVEAVKAETFDEAATGESAFDPSDQFA